MRIPILEVGAFLSYSYISLIIIHDYPCTRSSYTFGFNKYPLREYHYLKIIERKCYIKTYCPFKESN